MTRRGGCTRTHALYERYIAGALPWTPDGCLPRVVGVAGSWRGVVARGADLPMQARPCSPKFSRVRVASSARVSTTARRAFFTSSHAHARVYYTRRPALAHTLFPPARFVVVVIVSALFSTPIFTSSLTSPRTSAASLSAVRVP